MNKSIILLILLSALLFITLLPVPNARSATLYVDPTKSCDPGAYNTVSDALLAASDGDTIILCVDITDEAGIINVNVNITISGFYGGIVHTWTINDTDIVDYSISIASNKKLVLDNIDIIFQKDFGVLGEYANSILLNVNSELEIVNSYLESRFGNAAGSQILADTSKVIVVNSMLYAHGPSYHRNVYLLDSNLSAVDSILDVSSWGAPIYIDWTNPLYDYYLYLANSEVSSSEDGIHVTDISWVTAFIELEDVTFYTSSKAIYFSYITDSYLQTNLTDVSIYADYTGLYYDDAYDSYVELYIFNSTINTSYECLYIDDNEGNYFYVEIDPSLLISTYGNIIYVYESDFFTDLYIIVEDSEMYAYDYDAIYIDYVNYYSYMLLWLEDVYIYTYYSGIYVYDIYDDGYLDIYVRDSEILADDEVFYIEYVEYFSTLYIEVDPSNLTSINDEVLYIYDVYDYSQVDIIFESTILNSPYDDAIYIDYIEYDSVLNITLRNSEGYSDDNFIYVYEVYYYSVFGLYIESSDIRSAWETIYVGYVEFGSVFDIFIDPSTLISDRDEIFYISDVDDSVVNANIVDSELIAPESETFEIEDAYDDSEVYLTIDNSRFVSEKDTYGLEIDLSSDTYSEIMITHSIIGSIAVYSGDYPMVWVYESVVNETGSRISSRTTMYVEWTVAVKAINKFGNPVAGATVFFYNGSTFLGSSLTNGMGYAYYTYSYFFNNQPAFNDLNYAVTFSGSSNSTQYVAYNQSHTLPSWYESIDIIIGVIFANVDVFGNQGMGKLTLTQTSGKIVLFSIYSNNMIQYQVNVRSITIAGEYMVIKVTILMNGNLVKGYIAANFHQRMLHIRAGSLELYGFF